MWRGFHSLTCFVNRPFCCRHQDLFITLLESNMILERNDLMNRSLTTMIVIFTVLLHFLSRLHTSKFSLTSFDLANFICWCVKSGGGQGGQNLPPPVPYSPASRTFISRLPPVSVLLPSPVNWQSQNTS